MKHSILYSTLFIFLTVMLYAGCNGLFDDVFFSSKTPDPWQLKIEIYDYEIEYDQDYFVVEARGANPLRVDWGDGSVSDLYSISRNEVGHKYGETGIYTVSISGVADSIDFWHPLNPDNRIIELLTPIQGVKGITSLSDLFSPIQDRIAYIPIGFLDNYPNLTNVAHIFAVSSALTNIPTGLFDKNKKIVDFSLAFYGTTSLDFSGAIVGEGEPELWDRAGQSGYPVSIKGTNFALNSHTNFRAIVPISWGGTME